MNDASLSQNPDRSPQEVFDYTVAMGVRKAGYSWHRTLSLAILAGTFIALGGVVSTSAAAGSTLPWGLNKLVQGLVFCVGLILVLVGGGELFTGNILMTAAFFEKKISLSKLLRNWGLVYAGNAIGSLLFALLMLASRQFTFGDGAVGVYALKIAASKLELGFTRALLLGIACNILVCMAVWLTYAARTTAGKILALLFPVTAFVAAGFEHSIANMYLIPIGLLIKSLGGPLFWNSGAVTAAGYAPSQFSGFTWGAFLVNNLLPVTLGNILGGAVFVTGLYWLAFHQPRQK